MKKRLLFCSESSNLSTGYAVYAREVLTRLHKRGNIDFLEYANWGKNGEYQPPWPYVGVLPNNQQEEQIYNSAFINKFGAYKFESVCLEYKPDVVFNFTDFWMQSHILTSPFRRYYKYIAMPTVDCTPQQEEWINGYKQSDYVLNYSIS